MSESKRALQDIKSILEDAGWKKPGEAARSETTGLEKASSSWISFSSLVGIFAMIAALGILAAFFFSGR